MRRILVTGATGFIGYEVSRQLADSGLRPRLLVRRPERGAMLASLEAELVRGDLRDPASLERAVREVDTIIHLGARAAFESYHRLWPSIVAGSTALMQAASQAGVRTFVFASSLFVYGNQPHAITADTPVAPAIDYGRAKVEAERQLATLARQTGMGFAAVRLPHVYGARSLLFEHLRRGLIVLPGLGDNAFAHLHVEDAARALIGVATQGWTGISAVADDRPASWQEFFAVLREHYTRFRVVRLPAWLARLGTHLLRPLQGFQNRPTLTTPDTVIGWNLSLPVTPRLLWHALDMKPTYASIVSGIPAALDDSVAFRWRHPLADRSRF